VPAPVPAPRPVPRDAPCALGAVAASAARFWGGPVGLKMLIPLPPSLLLPLPVSLLYTHSLPSRC
jgi:hypothetical protein